MTVTKEMFFAQYYGQEVLASPYFKGTVEVRSIESYIGSGYLELRGIDSLTDEEMRELIKHVCPEHNDIRNIRLSKQSIIFEFFHCGQRHSLGFQLNHNMLSEVSDFLRTKSLLLPYMGKSVSEILKDGWAVIK